MDMTLKGLVQAAVDTIRDPRAGARRIMSLQMPRKARWQVLILIVVLSAILAQISFMVATLGTAEFGTPFQSSPFTLGGVQLVLLVSMVFGIHLIGTRAGGRGRFDDAILLVAWLQFVMMCLQFVQTIAMLVLPVMSLLIGLGGLVLFFWMLVNFIAELHGFKSLTAIFLAVLLSMVAFAIILSILLGMFGIYAPGVV